MFDQRLDYVDDRGIFIDRFRELLDRGEAFEFTDDERGFRVDPTDELLTIIEDMS